MASTEKISLSLDTGALLLARRAAEIDGLSLSAWMSRLVRRHAWESERPRLSADEQARGDERAAADDDQELGLFDEGRRAAG
ncbi:MAG: hypothetical protein ACRDSN_20470 [Pseudonocardiaceae bacterium]